MALGAEEEDPLSLMRLPSLMGTTPLACAVRVRSARKWASGATADEVLQLRGKDKACPAEMISRSRAHAPRPLLCHTISDDGGVWFIAKG